MVARKGQPNPNPGVDPAYRPDWKERARERAQPDTEQLRHRLAFRVTGEFVFLLARAAKMRGMTSAGYARRAVAAFIAEDLQIPFEDLCGHFPAPKNSPVHEVRRRLSVTWKRDDGNGYGRWKVQP